MRKMVVLSSILLALLITACDSSTPATTATATLQRFTGQGQQVSPKFTLTTGLATFQMKHDGDRNFIIWLMDDKGNRVDLLVNKSGNFDGSKAVKIERTGVYLMNIQASGNWTVSIEQ